MKSYLYVGAHRNPLSGQNCDGRAILVGPDDAKPPPVIERLPGMCLDCIAVGIEVTLAREIPCVEMP